MFVESDWKYVTSESGSGGGGPVALSGAGLYLEDNDRNQYLFECVSLGASHSITPAGVEVSTTDMVSMGTVYRNTKKTTTLKVADIQGTCIVLQGSMRDLLFPPFGAGNWSNGTSICVIFFGVGLGIAKGWLQTVAVGAVLPLTALFPPAGVGLVTAASYVIPHTILSDCHGFCAVTGRVFSTEAAGVSGGLGYMSGKQGFLRHTVLGIWNVVCTQTGKYDYQFNNDGTCSYFKDSRKEIADGKGTWKFNGTHIEISWDSGSVEKWNLPLQVAVQIGIGVEKLGREYGVIAKKQF